MDNRLTRSLHARPESIFWSYSLNVALYSWLLAIGARPKVVILGGIFCAAGLCFIYVCIRSGFVLSRGKRYTITETPQGFWLSMVFCYVIYLIGTFFAVLIHVQDLQRAP